VHAVDNSVNDDNLRNTSPSLVLTEDAPTYQEQSKVSSSLTMRKKLGSPLDVVEDDKDGAVLIS
jgi:hypothetical protein